MLLKKLFLLAPFLLCLRACEVPAVAQPVAEPIWYCVFSCQNHVVCLDTEIENANFSNGGTIHASERMTGRDASGAMYHAQLSGTAKFSPDCGGYCRSWTHWELVGPGDHLLVKLSLDAPRQIVCDNSDSVWFQLP